MTGNCLEHASVNGTDRTDGFAKARARTQMLRDWILC